MTEFFSPTTTLFVALLIVTWTVLRQVGITRESIFGLVMVWSLVSVLSVVFADMEKVLVAFPRPW